MLPFRKKSAEILPSRARRFRSSLVRFRVFALLGLHCADRIGCRKTVLEPAIELVLVLLALTGLALFIGVLVVRGRIEFFVRFHGATPWTSRVSKGERHPG